MNHRALWLGLFVLGLTILLATETLASPGKSSPKLVYLVSDARIPFWGILEKGIRNKAAKLGYQVEIASSENSAKKELELLQSALIKKPAGLIVSPTTSSACSTILRLAKDANIPVVIADIGTDSGDYIAYISSNNRQGAYDLGKILASQMRQKGWEGGRVGIIAIPQKRANGQARTAGFMQALREENIRGADIKQQVDFSYQETFDFSQELIQSNPDLRAIWLQGSNRYQAALDAIAKSGKAKEILLITFDAEPEYLELIPKKTLVGAGMQQPFLMGEIAVETLHQHLQGKRVEPNIQLPVLAVSPENIREKLPLIQRNVLGANQ